jgi:hypothetical protein
MPASAVSIGISARNSSADEAVKKTMQRRRRYSTLGFTTAVLALCAGAVLAEHFDATLSGPQIELKFQRIRAAHKLEIDGPLPWVFAFSGPDSAKVEALSLRLVRDGFHIVSLQAMEGLTTLRVTRTELLTPSALERRGRELAKLARAMGVPSYDGADIGTPR